jgi:hypothetical protein
MPRPTGAQSKDLHLFFHAILSDPEPSEGESKNLRFLNQPLTQSRDQQEQSHEVVAWTANYSSIFVPSTFKNRAR